MGITTQLQRLLADGYRAGQILQKDPKDFPASEVEFLWLYYINVDDRKEQKYLAAQRAIREERVQRE
jgi:hypothetical protein